MPWAPQRAPKASFRSVRAVSTLAHQASTLTDSHEMANNRILIAFDEQSSVILKLQKYISISFKNRTIFIRKFHYADDVR